MRYVYIERGEEEIEKERVRRESEGKEEAYKWELDRGQEGRERDR
jgi:hypothetical protein